MSRSGDLLHVRPQELRPLKRCLTTAKLLRRTPKVIAAATQAPRGQSVRTPLARMLMGNPNVMFLPLGWRFGACCCLCNVSSPNAGPACPPRFFHCFDAVGEDLHRGNRRMAEVGIAGNLPADAFRPRCASVSRTPCSSRMTRSISSIDAPASAEPAYSDYRRPGSLAASTSLRCRCRTETSRRTNSRVSPSNGFAGRLIDVNQFSDERDRA